MTTHMETSTHTKRDEILNRTLVGCGVGASDTVLFYPFQVLATRRETGMSLRKSVQMGKYWSGGMTFATLLIPYSICVEAATTVLNRSFDDVPGGPLLASFVTANTVTAFLQPIEKKLVVGQLLQNDPYKSFRNPVLKPLQPMYEIAQYQQRNGLRALYSGYSALLAREMIYIVSITVVNPVLVKHIHQGFDRMQSPGVRKEEDHRRSVGLGLASSFLVGFAAGMLSAPVQTINAMMKDERNRSIPATKLIRDIYSEGFRKGTVRMFYGASIRSTRTGGAGILYYTWRRILGVEDQ